jgi:hypothetical protein
MLSKRGGEKPKHPVDSWLEPYLEAQPWLTYRCFPGVLWSV